MSKDNSEAAGIVVLILTAIFFTFVGGMFGYGMGLSAKESQAVRLGHGYYVADTFGKPQFQWKERP